MKMSMVKEKISVEEMASRFKKVASASIYDVLDKMGLGNQCLSLNIKPLRNDMRVSGQAFTVHGLRAIETDEEWQKMKPKFKDWGMFKAMHPHCIVVVNAEKERHCGHWGEMMSYTAKQYGATGIVIDGGIRDGLGLLAIPDWPVFVRYTSPVESAKRWRPQDFQMPIFMSGTLSSQVKVSPGDWVVGDMDGVLIVPQEIAMEVLLRVEEVEDREDKSRRALASGMPIREVYEKYGRL
jgi:regulator of RNase E activity RraA